jgi:glycosyltransferase involved in cell wall biosynthesis
MNAARKRILYCEGNMDSSVGGSHYSLFYLVESLDKSRYEPIVVFHRENRLIPMYRQAGLDTRVFPYRSAARLPAGLPRSGPAGRALQLALNVVNIWRMVIAPGFRCAAYLKKNRIDLVHLNNTIIRNHHWMLGAMLAGVKCVSHERGINERMSWFPRLFARRLSAILCISGPVRENLARQGIAAAQLVVVHNGLDPDRIRAGVEAAEIRQRHGIGKDAPVIGIIGNIKEWKGQDVVVRATARLRERWPDIRCLLVGDTEVDPEYETRLRALVAERSLQQHVIFTGYQANVADYLNVMDVMIHASVLPEPFGRVLLEAMAMKKPVVGSRDGAIPEIIQEGHTGLMFAPGDDAELARAVAVLLEDAARARQMGENGYLRAGREFGIKKNVQKTQELYERLFSPDALAG